ncbi:MAG: hypothetical protein IPM53_01260 [Anaerolineaceae bacterium]|nr:hypothetical protein [Anaerolineaceae bacterium]
MSIRSIMNIDTIVNLVLMLCVLAVAPLLANAVGLQSTYPIYGIAMLFGVSALSHWAAGRSQSRAAVQVMMVMDGCTTIVLLLLAALNPMAAPAWLRVVFCAGALLALFMGWLKFAALRKVQDPAR